MSKTSDDRPLFSYTIGGVKIEMPVRPYPSQVSMMDKVNIWVKYLRKHILYLFKFLLGYSWLSKTAKLSFGKSYRVWKNIGFIVFGFSMAESRKRFVTISFEIFINRDVLTSFFSNLYITTLLCTEVVDEVVLDDTIIIRCFNL